MRADGRELLDVVARFPGIPLLVAGDLIVDHYIWGTVERISPEAPVVVVQVTSEDWRPGGAGNVVRNLVSLGADVSVCGVVGEDPVGARLRAMFQESGVDLSGIVTEAERPTTVKSRVIAHSQQVVRIDREVVDALLPSPADVLAAAIGERLRSVRGVILSDYGKGVVCEAVYQRLVDAHGEGLLGLRKIPLLIDPKLAGFPLYRHATVIKPNRKEAEEATGLRIRSTADAIEAGRLLLARWRCEVVLLTLGEEGMVLVTDLPGEERAIEVDTVARDVYDVSGAGDTVSAVFMLALAAGATLRQAALLANYAAGIAVGEVGTVAVTAEQLEKVIRREVA